LILLSTVLSALGLIFAKPLLTMLKTPADTFDFTLSYYRIVITGMPLSFPMFVYQSAMNGYGDTMSPLKIAMFTALVNLILDPLLIFGWLGFPALGVNGAAITTVVTRALASAIGLYLFFSGKKGIRLKLSHLKPNIDIAKLMVKIGVPSAIGFSGSALGFIVLISIVNLFGTPVVSAYGIATRIVHFYMLPAMGISSAVTAIVGQNLGAGQIQRAKEVVKKGIYLMLFIVIPPITLTAIFGKEVTAIFIPNDPLVHQLGQVMFYITPPSLIFFGLGTVIEGAFHGAGYTLPVMVAQISRIWVFRIPFVYLLSIIILDGPEDVHASVGIWWGMVISNGAALLLLAIWYHVADWAKPKINTAESQKQ
jgi:putative MATE family efflux protein